jgi:hypothetical protein
MALNNLNGFMESKIHDKRIVDYFKEKYNNTRLATDNEDKQKKFDIIINNHKIDTKIFRSDFSKTNLYYEYEKHSENSLSEAEYIWIFIKTKEDKNKLLSESYLISIKKLRELSNSGKCKTWIGLSGDKLMTFDLNMLSLNKDYYIKNIPEISYIKDIKDIK